MVEKSGDDTAKQDCLAGLQLVAGIVGTVSNLMTTTTVGAGVGVFYIEGATIVSSGEVVLSTAGKCVGVVGGALNVGIGFMELWTGIDKLTSENVDAGKIDKYIDAVNKSTQRVDELLARFGQ